MLKLFLLVLVLVALAFLGLGINIIFFKKPFPETEVSRNKDMRRLGIKCTKCEEMRIYRAQQNAKKNLRSVTLDVEKLKTNER